MKKPRTTDVGQSWATKTIFNCRATCCLLQTQIRCFSAITSKTSKRTRGAKQASRVMIVWFASHLHERRENWEHLRSLRLTHRLVQSRWFFGIQLTCSWCCIPPPWSIQSSAWNLSANLQSLISGSKIHTQQDIAKPSWNACGKAGSSNPSWHCSCAVLADTLAVACAVHSLRVLTSVKQRL